MTSLDRLLVRAYSTMAVATSRLGRIAVLAPSSSASLTVSRMRWRLASGRRCKGGVSTYAACQDTALCCAAWPDAAKDGRLGLPDAIDGSIASIRLDVVLDTIGGAAQQSTS